MQRVQLAALVWLRSGCWLPAGHSAGATAPGVTQKAPAGQGAHAAADTDPDAELNEPECNQTGQRADGAALVKAGLMNVRARRREEAAVRDASRLTCWAEMARRLSSRVLILARSTGAA